MRLEQHERAGIISAIEGFIDQQPGKLYLYGSRVDDTLRGGDIDLLLLVSDPHVDSINSVTHHVLAEIKGCIGDRKIDLIVAGFSDDNPFIKVILPKAILLKEWLT